MTYIVSCSELDKVLNDLEACYVFASKISLPASLHTPQEYFRKDLKLTRNTKHGVKNK